MRLRMETPNPLEEVVKEQGSRLEFLEESVKEYRVKLEKLEVLLHPENPKSTTEKENHEELQIELPKGPSGLKHNESTRMPMAPHQGNNQDTGVTTKLVQMSGKRSHHSDVSKTEISKKQKSPGSNAVPSTISTFEGNPHSKERKGGKLNDASISSTCSYQACL